MTAKLSQRPQNRRKVGLRVFTLSATKILPERLVQLHRYTPADIELAQELRHDYGFPVDTVEFLTKIKRDTIRQWKRSGIILGPQETPFYLVHPRDTIRQLSELYGYTPQDIVAAGFPHGMVVDVLAVE